MPIGNTEWFFSASFLTSGGYFSAVGLNIAKNQVSKLTVKGDLNEVDDKLLLLYYFPKWFQMPI